MKSPLKESSDNRNEWLYEFYNDCLALCDLQQFKLESEEAKRCCIQAIRFKIRERLNDPNYGPEWLINIINGSTARGYAKDNPLDESERQYFKRFKMFQKYKKGDCAQNK